MLSERSETTLCDAPELAAAVRSLALRAHRVLNDPLADGEAYELLGRRIARLNRRYPVEAKSSLGRWLVNLSRRVEAATMPPTVCSNC